MENQDQVQQYECLLFDLDDTLYPQASGISAQVTENIKEYMIKNLRIEASKVPELCVYLYKNYGTTMAGLKAIGYNFDFDDFHAFVHGRLPYNLLKPDPVLRSLLLSLPIRKVLFTNGDKAHAARALNRLGLEGCFQFQDIISFETLNPSQSDLDMVETVSSNGTIDVDRYLHQPDSNLELPRTPIICKPFEEAYEKVFKIVEINPRRTMFFDDSVRNLQTAKRLGITTVMIGSSQRTSGVDYALESIHNIKEALPELWEAVEKTKSVAYTREAAIETFIRA